MFSKFHKVIFWLFLFSIPFGLAKRFITSDSYISGIYIDFLTPSIYLHEVLLIFLFFSSLKGGLNLSLLKNNKIKTPLILFSVFIFILLISSKSFISLIFILRLLGMLFLMLYIISNFKWEKDYVYLLNIISGSVLVQSFIALIQYLKKGSVFNNYLFLGEFPYTSKTPGILRDVLFGNIVIPPYGTFPHPNILGGFLAIGLVLIAYIMLTKKFNWLSICAFFYGLIALVLTVSYSAYIAFGIGILYLFLIPFKKYIFKISFILILAFILLTPFIVRNTFQETFHSFSSLYRRADLILISENMIKANPLKGVGTNLYTQKMKDYGTVRGPLSFFEPVHNIYFLIASEAGLLSLLVFLTFFYSIFRHSNDITPLFLILLLQCLLIGFLDHYLITYPQGLAFLWLTISWGLSTIHLEK